MPNVRLTISLSYVTRSPPPSKQAMITLEQKCHSSQMQRVKSNLDAGDDLGIQQELHPDHPTRSSTPKRKTQVNLATNPSSYLAALTPPPSSSTTAPQHEVIAHAVRLPEYQVCTSCRALPEPHLRPPCVDRDKKLR
jgi:hypothetical protein